MTISVATFLQVAPEFSSEDPNRISAFIAYALPYINSSIWLDKSDFAQALLTAHFLKSSPNTSSGGAGVPLGPVSSEKVGDLSRAYATAPISSASTYETTSYGQLFLQIRRSLLISPMVVR